jgi:hypothetical protein
VSRRDTQTWIASSELKLRPAQRALLRQGERAIEGVGHAERTIVDVAKAEGAVVEAVAASRPVCPPCAAGAAEAGAKVVSPLKQVKP